MDDREPGRSPSRPQTKRTKRGYQIFPPDRPTIWAVGAQMGALLRQERADAMGTGRTVRPHIRRGHWHGYWTGPRGKRQKFVYRWLPPMVVAGGYDERNDVDA